MLFYGGYDKITEIFFSAVVMFGKMIFKTALKTVLGLIIAVIVIVAVWVLAAPQSAATICEKANWYSAAVNLSALRYKYTGGIEDLSRCAEDGIYSAKDKYILKYGEELLDKDGYSELCSSKDETIASSAFAAYAPKYDYFISGYVAVSLFNTGDTDGGVERALASNGAESFGYGNPLAKLALAVAERGGESDISKLLSALDTLTVTEEYDTAYLSDIIGILENQGD